MIFYNVDPERTLDLLYLCEVISRFKEIPERISDKLFRLQGFAVEVRYPNEIIQLSGEEIDLAIKISEEVRQFVISTIESK